MRGRVKRPWDQTAPKHVKCHGGPASVHLCAESAPVNRRPESVRCHPSKMPGLRLPPLDVRRPAPDSSCLGVQDGLQRTVRLNRCRRRRLIIRTDCRVARVVRRHQSALGTREARRDSSPALRASVANRVGGRRGCLTAPFPPPPSEPDWRLSYSSGSPVVRSGLPLPEWWPCRFSAPHVACLPAVPPTSRPPFATWTAFPSS